MVVAGGWGYLVANGRFDIVMHAGFVCQGADFAVRVCRDEDLDGMGIQLPDPSEEFQSIHSRQPIISNNDVIISFLECLNPLLRGLAGIQRTPLHLKKDAQGIPDPLVIIDEQDFFVSESILILSLSRHENMAWKHDYH